MPSIRVGGQADYAQTMRVRGPIQSETSDGAVQTLLMFSVFYRLAWYGVEIGIALIPQRSVVQIHPPAVRSK
jgi:hypothetical protein